MQIEASFFSFANVYYVNWEQPMFLIHNRQLIELRFQRALAQAYGTDLPFPWRVKDKHCSSGGRRW